MSNITAKQAPAVREPLVHLTKRAAIHPAAGLAIRAAAILAALAVCGLAAFLLIPDLQKDPSRIGEFYQCFWNGSFSTYRKTWTFLKNAAILLSISLAVTPAFRMRFWNTGAEGQTLVGVLGAIAVDFYLGGKIPEPLLLVLMLLAALASGAVWGLIPAIFKAKWNTNETLFTLMMNYVATYLVSYFLIIWVPSGSSALGKLSNGKLPGLDLAWMFPNPSSDVTSILKLSKEYLLIVLIVVALAVLLYIYLSHSKHGYEISVVGESERTAKYVGISVPKVIIRTMLLSGALCGLAGYLIAAGLDQSVNTESVGGQGFTAIMVSWLAKFNPLVMLFTSSLIVVLNLGAAQISKTFQVESALPNVITGIILFFVIGCEFFINYQLHFRKKHVEVAVK